MSYERRKVNRQKREKKYRILILIIAILLILIILSSLFNRTGKTILPTEDVYLKETDLQGVLIKDESVYKLTQTKDIKLDELEGQKIEVGKKIGDNTILNDLKILRKDLKEIENAISILGNSNKDKVFKNDKKNLIENFNIEIESLQESIYSKNYKNINKYKEEISIIDKKINDLLPQNNLLGQSINSLKDKREKLKKEINQKNSSYKSKKSGILSYEIDGYENLYRPQEFENYTYDKLEIPDKNIDALGKIENSEDIIGFKIIDNFEWYLALKVEDRKGIPKYNLGDTLKIKYLLADSELEINGSIVSINDNSNRSVIILQFNEYLHDFYNARFPKVKLVQEKIEVLKIPSSIILEKDNRKGVYIKDFSGIVKFKPIKVIKTIGEYTYIDRGKNSLVSINGKENVQTISIYDEIFIKPYKLKEGQIVN